MHQSNGADLMMTMPGLARINPIPHELFHFFNEKLMCAEMCIGNYPGRTQAVWYNQFDGGVRDTLQ